MSFLIYPGKMLRNFYQGEDNEYDSRSTGGGFTAIELLVVVMIMAIAAFTVVPMLSSASSMQIRSAANMIMADLEYAKSMAISRGQGVAITRTARNRMASPLATQAISARATATGV